MVGTGAIGRGTEGWALPPFGGGVLGLRRCGGEKEGVGVFFKHFSARSLVRARPRNECLQRSHFN